MIKTYTVKPAAFAEQMKALMPVITQFYQISCVSICCTTLHYLKTSNDFDDTGEQFSIGANEMDKYGFKSILCNDGFD
jgi:hypothetical protein